jgi:ABC-type multidrug transport system fused ATPase/permease subunit
MADRTVSRAGWRMLLRQLARRPALLARLAIWSTVESLPALLSGVLVAAAVDRGFLVHRPLVGFGWLALLGLSILLQSVARRASFPILADLAEPVRDVFVRSVVTATLTRTVAGAEQPTAETVARVCGQVENVRGLVSALLRTLRPTLVAVVLALVGVAALAPALVAVTVPPVAAGLAVFGLSLRGLARRERARVLGEEAVARASGEVFGGLRDIAACGAERRAGQVVRAAVEVEAAAAVSLARAASVRSVVVAVGGYLPLALAVLLAPRLVRSHTMTAGEVVGAVTYLGGSLIPAMRALVGAIGGWGRQLGVTLHRLAETSRLPDSPATAGSSAPSTVDLLLTGVTFAYGPLAEPVVDDLSLAVDDGEHLAIIGASGIGKSTLAALMTGLFRPQAGSVTLGGAPLADIAEDQLRRTVALIPQEAYVFTGTVGDNLRYLRPGVTVDELDAAVDRLGMRPLLDRLGGYDASVGIGGAGLSAGERQLFALVRVYVSHARLVVLDEATCHLDPGTEARAEDAFAASGRTVVVIAHRISSARRARRILLLDGSAVVSGTHDTLARDSPVYAALVGHWSATAVG